MAAGLKAGTDTGAAEEFDFLEPQRRWRRIAKVFGGVLPALALVGFIASGDGEGAGEPAAKSGPARPKLAVAAASAKLPPSVPNADPVVNGSEPSSVDEPPPEGTHPLVAASAQQAPHKRKAGKPATRRLARSRRAAAR